MEGKSRNDGAIEINPAERLMLQEWDEPAVRFRHLPERKAQHSVNTEERKGRVQRVRFTWKQMRHGEMGGGKA